MLTRSDNCLQIYFNTISIHLMIDIANVLILMKNLRSNHSPNLPMRSKSGQRVCDKENQPVNLKDKLQK
jgi:hypothetical protein